MSWLTPSRHSFASLTHWRGFIDAVSPVVGGWGWSRESVRWSLCFGIYLVWLGIYVSIYITVRPSPCSSSQSPTLKLTRSFSTLPQMLQKFLLLGGACQGLPLAPKATHTDGLRVQTTRSTGARSTPSACVSVLLSPRTRPRHIPLTFPRRSHFFVTERLHPALRRRSRHL